MTLRGIVRGAALVAAALLLSGQTRSNWDTVVVETDFGHRVGNPDAKVKLVEFFSYTCPHCAEFAEQGEGAIKLGYLAPGKINVEYRRIVEELCSYAAKNKRWGEPGTGGHGEKNVGLGGPAYKPSQNSNTMVNYVLKRCGVERTAPDMAVGWNTVPHFPYSGNVDAIPLDTQP